MERSTVQSCLAAPFISQKQLVTGAIALRPWRPVARVQTSRRARAWRIRNGASYFAPVKAFFFSGRGSVMIMTLPEASILTCSSWRPPQATAPDRGLDVAVEEAGETLADDLLGFRHDAVDQFFHGRDVVDQSNLLAAASGRHPSRRRSSPRDRRSRPARGYRPNDTHPWVYRRHLFILCSMQAYWAPRRSLGWTRPFLSIIVTGNCRTIQFLDDISSRAASLAE